MNGLIVDPSASVRNQFKLALAVICPDLELEAVAEVPPVGAYDLVIFRAPRSAEDVAPLAQALREVSRPGATFFAYCERPDRRMLQALLRARCRCGADATRPEELRWLWTEVRDEVQLRLAAARDASLKGAASSIKELLHTWRACMWQAERAG